MNGKDWYKEQLATDEWKELRQKVYERDGRACVECGEKRIRIHCHHTYYVKFKRPWEYPLEAFITLCDKHHESRHKSIVMQHATQEDAEMWLAFEEAEQQFMKEELRLIDNRIEALRSQGADWDSNGRFFGLVDASGRSRFFDEDGNEL